MSNFFDPGFRLLDTNGDPISGGLLYFYEAGTSTPLATYPTEADLAAGTNANTNPLAADGNGLIAEVFGQDQAYKLVCKSSDTLTTHWTRDNVNPYLLRSTAVTTRLLQIASDPITQGAVGDGVSDESSYVQAAIDAATCVVDLLGKTYKCNSQLTMASGLRMINGTLDFTSCTDGDYIVFQGSRGSAVLLSGDAAEGDTSFAVADATGIAAGDLLLLASTLAYKTGYAGELVRVVSVSGTTITISGKLRGAYATANGAYVKELTSVKRAGLENITITSGTGNGQSIVLLDACDDVEIKNVRVSGSITNRAAFMALSSIDCRFIDCEVRDTGSSAYGVQLSEACERITLDRFRQIDGYFGISVATAGEGSGTGVCRNTVIRDCDLRELNTGIEIGVDSDLTRIEGGQIDGCSARGVYCQGPRVSVRGMNLSNDVHGVVWVYNGTAWPAYVETHALSVEDCRFEDLTNGVYTADEFVGLIVRNCKADSVTNLFNLADSAASKTYSQLEISDNRGATAITIAPTGATCTLSRCRICRNEVTSISISDGAGGLALSRVKIDGNMLTTPTGDAISIEIDSAAASDDVSICHNTIDCDGISNAAIWFDTASYITCLRIDGNHIDSDNEGILITTVAANSLGWSVNDNVVNCAAGTAIDIALGSTGNRYFTVNDNAVRTAARALRITGYLNNFTISGAYASSGTGTPVIDLQGSAGNAIGDGSANVSTYKGTYGINGTNTESATILAQGSFADFATADTNGVTEGDVV